MVMPLINQCSHKSTAAQKSALKYLTAKSQDRFPAQEFEEALSREVYLAGGNYHIVAFPYTEAYLKAMVMELTEEKALSKKESSKILNRLKNNFVVNKTCFKFRYSVLRFNEVGQLKDWQVTLFNIKGLKAELTWQSQPKRDPSFADSKNYDPLNELHDKWLGDGIACLSRKLNLTESFGLKVKPQYVQFPFDSHGDLYWELENAPRKLRHQETDH